MKGLDTCEATGLKRNDWFKKEKDTCVANGQLLSWLNQPTCQHLENKKVDNKWEYFWGKDQEKITDSPWWALPTKLGVVKFQNLQFLGLSLSPPAYVPFPP